MNLGSFPHVSIGPEPLDGVGQGLLGGVCGRPSSRMALAGLKNILCLAMRTPASGALGGFAVNRERVSSRCAAARATR